MGWSLIGSDNFDDVGSEVAIKNRTISGSSYKWGELSGLTGRTAQGNGSGAVCGIDETTSSRTMIVDGDDNYVLFHSFKLSFTTGANAGNRIVALHAKRPSKTTYDNSANLGYQFIINNTNGGSILIYKLIGASTTTLDSETGVGLANQTFTIELVGDSLKTYIDGVEVLSATNTVVRGPYAIEVFLENSDVTIDNIQMWSDRCYDDWEVDAIEDGFNRAPGDDLYNVVIAKGTAYVWYSTPLYSTERMEMDAGLDIRSSSGDSRAILKAVGGSSYFRPTPFHIEGTIKNTSDIRVLYGYRNPDEATMNGYQLYIPPSGNATGIRMLKIVAGSSSVLQALPGQTYSAGDRFGLLLADGSQIATKNGSIIMQDTDATFNGETYVPHIYSSATSASWHTFSVLKEYNYRVFPYMSIFRMSS